MTYRQLPPISPPPMAQFDFDANASSATIDEYIGNSNAAIYDTRPLLDTFHVEQPGIRRTPDEVIAQAWNLFMMKEACCGR